MVKDPAGECFAPHLHSYIRYAIPLRVIVSSSFHGRAAKCGPQAMQRDAVRMVPAHIVGDFERIVDALRHRRDVDHQPLDVMVQPAVAPHEGQRHATLPRDALVHLQDLH